VQRFFNRVIAWPQIFVKFFEQHLCQPEGEHILVGDETVVTKSGKETHGLGHFFSGLVNKVVKGIAIFSLSLVSVAERRSYPLSAEQVVRFSLLIVKVLFTASGTFFDVNPVHFSIDKNICHEWGPSTNRARILEWNAA
jgi:hypothetical protein